MPTFCHCDHPVSLGRCVLQPQVSGRPSQRGIIRDHVQGCSAGIVPDIRVSSGIEERREHVWCLAYRRRDVERGAAGPVVPGVRIGPGLEQRVNRDWI